MHENEPQITLFSEAKKADADASSPLPHRAVENKSPFVDGVCSSDLGGEEWETASDASHDQHDYVVARQVGSWFSIIEARGLYLLLP